MEDKKTQRVAVKVGTKEIIPSREVKIEIGDCSIPSREVKVKVKNHS